MVGPGSRVFEKYEVIRRIAVGGMGEIYLARQTGVVDRLVILKSLLPQLANDAQALAQFLDEARILGSINHPNICALFDVGEWGGQYFIAMEYINGVDIAAVLKFCEEHKKRLPPLTSAHIVRDAALGLDAAHVATDATGQPLRVVHRDVSPHNIMIRQDGLAKVLDFGVALAENRMQHTEAGMLKGKLGYMPPEQIKGAPVDPKADQFSLGVVLWEMLTQRRLFTGENAAQVFMRILKETVPAPSSLVPDVPVELDEIVLRMTANDPTARFARLGDAGAAIRRVLEQYKSPENAAALLIRATVGSELTARIKELASTPRVEMPASTPAAGFKNIPRTGTGTTPTPTSHAFCGSCGSQAQPGDRFCRVCGSAIGQQSTPSPRLTGSTTGSIPRVDVLSQTMRSPIDPTISSVGSHPPETAVETREPSVELAVVCGVVEMLVQGQVVEASMEAREQTGALLDDVAAKASGTIERRADGRFSVTFAGEGAAARAVRLAQASVRIAARAGLDVMLRMAVVADVAPLGLLGAIRANGEALAENCPPGSAIVVESVLEKAGRPATLRSAQVQLPHGTVVAHELRLPRRLLGRGNEIALIDAALDEVSRTSRSSQIMLLGDGGLGKTALLELGRALARDRGFLTGMARGARFVAPLSLDVLRQLIRDVAADVLRWERVEGEWSRVLELLSLPSSVAAHVMAIVDDQDVAGLADIPAGRRRAVMKGAVLGFFERLTERYPIALFVDDHQQGDAQSFEFLAELGARLGERRLFMVLAGRPVQGVRVLPMAKRLTLSPLSPADIAMVAAMTLGAPVHDPLSTLITTRANGNPFVLSVLLRHLTGLGQLATTPLGAQLQGPAERLNAPTNPTALLHANHALLSVDAQTVLVAAAHLGLVFSTSELPKLIDGAKDLPAILRSLSDIGIVEALAGDRWSFRSTTEMQVIPGRLDAQQERRQQERVADALSKDVSGAFTLELGERLAVHLQAAEARPRAAQVSLQVAERAMSLGLFEVAADHAKRALAHASRTFSAQPTNEGHAARVLMDAALATAALTELDATAAVDVLAPVLKGVPPTLAMQARADALQKRGLAYARARKFAEAEGCFDEALEALQGAYDDAMAASILIDLAATLEARGDAAGSLAQIQEALRLFGQAPIERRHRACEALLHLGRSWLRQRQFDAAAQALHAAIDESRRVHRATIEAEARGTMGALLQAQARIDAAVVELEAAIAIASTLGDPVLEARLRQQVGRALVALGRRADAAAAIVQAIECARRGQWDEGVTACQQLLAVVGG
jgi:serine/threonine protein kinase/tetratricopeptide (TPR) repeat protein